VWRNFSDSKAGRHGHYAAVWRGGGRRSIRWNRNMPTMPRVRRKSALTATRKSRHISPDSTGSPQRMTMLSDLSQEIAQVVAGLAPSLVRVDARGGRPATGIIWADNLVLTADHVIEADDNILVTGAPTTVKASVAGRDRGTDLALLRTVGLRGAPAPRLAARRLRA